MEMAALEELCVDRGLEPPQLRPAVLQLDEPDGPLPGVPREDERIDPRDCQLVVAAEEADAHRWILRGEGEQAGFYVLAGQSRGMRFPN